MMGDVLGFYVVNLMTEEENFNIPGRIGVWEFSRQGERAKLLDDLASGKCARTYTALNSAFSLKSLYDCATQGSFDDKFETMFDDFLHICLLLSLITGKCVTTDGTVPNSDVQSLRLSDRVLAPRAICGFSPLTLTQKISDIFQKGLEHITASFDSRWLRLHLSYWISGLTCFTLEELFLSIGVQMDIVKQCQSLEDNSDYNYYSGMEKTSQKYGITPLSGDYRKMRNDIVHTGKLSDKNFFKKTKVECAQVIADSLNWLDEYFCKVTQIDNGIANFQRWDADQLANGLPAISF